MIYAEGVEKVITPASLPRVYRYVNPILHGEKIEIRCIETITAIATAPLARVIKAAAEIGRFMVDRGKRLLSATQKNIARGQVQSVAESGVISRIL